MRSPRRNYAGKQRTDGECRPHAFQLAMELVQRRVPGCRYQGVNVFIRTTQVVFPGD